MLKKAAEEKGDKPALKAFAVGLGRASFSIAVALCSTYVVISVGSAGGSCSRRQQQQQQ